VVFFFLFYSYFYFTFFFCRTLHIESHFYFRWKIAVFDHPCGQDTHVGDEQPPLLYGLQDTLRG